MASRAEKSEQELREAVEKLAERWWKADGAQKKANMEAGAVKKGEHDKIIAQAVRLGIPKGAFRDFITEDGHERDLVGHRDKVIAHDDADRLTHYDRLLRLTEVGLPLFPQEMVDQINASADRQTEEEVETADDKKVVSIKKSRKKDVEPEAEQVSA